MPAHVALALPVQLINQFNDSRTSGPESLEPDAASSGQHRRICLAVLTDRCGADDSHAFLPALTANPSQCRPSNHKSRYWLIAGLPSPTKKLRSMSSEIISPAIHTSLENVRALVTGGTRGIGLATVKRFLAGGAKVVTVARSEAEVPPGVCLIVADLAEPDAAAVVAEQAMKVLGSIDVLVNNVGSNVVTPGGLLTADDAQWQANLETNLMSAVRLDRHVVPPMIARGHGCVIHVSSVGALYPVQLDGIPYAAAKAALGVYSKGLANSAGLSGVRINTVMMGFIETDTSRVSMQEMADRSGVTVEALRAHFLQVFPNLLGRPGTGEEAAELITFLTGKGSYITGTQIVMDAGAFPAML